MPVSLTNPTVLPPEAKPVAEPVRKQGSVYAAKADCLYGATGTRKTSNIGLAALYVLEKYGKRTRLISADGGGWQPIDSLVQEGIVEPWMIASHKFPLTAMNQACDGYWPENVDDPGSPLKRVAPAEWEGIGLVAIEGLTSYGDSILQWFQKTGTRLSQDPSYSFSDGGGRTFHGGNMSYYGEIQSQLYSMVMRTNYLPCEKVLWTALEGRSEDETKSPIYGPAIAGKKATGKAGAWFGALLHIENVVTEGTPDAKTKQMPLIVSPRMYLRSHADPITRIPFPAKVRAPFQFASELPEFLDPPDVAELYRKLDLLQEKARASVRK